MSNIDPPQTPRTTSRSRLYELSLSINEYGKTSIAIKKIIHQIGDSIISALPGFLGDEAKVFGVPPHDSDWTPDDYRGAKFSTYRQGLLRVGPIQMGVAVAIPHLKNDGELWVRVVLDLQMEGSDISVQIGDGPIISGISQNYDQDTIEIICQAIFDYLKSMFKDPVRIATAEGSGKLGFRPT
ncbi:hypothetical protein [Inquilinus sp. CA228]|uniref:hypothetical protein n=1 Tax=Inquilinus sp. CA228 TaxID=3455609 RepID=UPI003F8D824E